jgi:threonine/homoserine/homoserine lactone efflux protein
MFSTEFLLTSLVVVLMPGTGVIYTVTTGLFSGRQASMAAALGCTAGIVPHLGACVLGLSAILHMGALAFQILKFAGAAYLLYLAWSLWRDKGALEFNKPANKKGLFQIILRGFLINILNPKLSIFFLAFLPLFVKPDTIAPIQQLLILSAAFMGMTLIIFICYGILASFVCAYFVNSPKRALWLQRTFAAVFAALAAKLAASELNLVS